MSDGDVRFGSLAAPFGYFSLMSALEGKAAVIRRPQPILNLCLLGQFERVVYLNTKITDRAFEFRVTKQ